MTKARDLASAIPAPSTVSSAELGYLDGVTSAIQTQVDAKIAKTLTTTTGDIIYASGANTPARLGIGSTSNVLTVAGGVPTWAAPAGGGKVLQVVSAITLTNAGSTSNTYIDTNLTATITPTSASSQVLVLVSQSFQSYNQSYAGWQLLREGSVIIEIAKVMMLFEGTNINARGISNCINYLDSPATTSATIYKTQFKRAGGASGGIDVQPGTNENYSTIILLEIGA